MYTKLVSVVQGLDMQSEYSLILLMHLRYLYNKMLRVLKMQTCCLLKEKAD